LNMGDYLSFFEWGVAMRPLLGQPVSGDQYLIAPSPGGILVAVLDGLGHGEEAARAAEIAVTTLKKNTHQSLTSMFEVCHTTLSKTRGVVMSTASFDVCNRTVSWVGVGNVEGILLRAKGDPRPAHEVLLLRGGVVGYQLPSLRVSVLPIMEGDILAFATDGIRHNFSEGLSPDDSPQQNADRILTCFGKETDDALVLVLRFRGKD
jgi:negative regulator of sigma-B (phosphoserine phosphatase)